MATITPRAYVGGVENFSLIGATLFAELVARGLKETDYVLDIGCGCLRVGKFLIPYLMAGRYYAVEPNDEVLHNGIEVEVGNAAFWGWDPHINNTDTFDFEGVFPGVVFDVAFAGSIFSHTDVPMTEACLRNVREVLSEDGVFHVTFIEHGTELAQRLLDHDSSVWPGKNVTGWQPQGVTYTADEMEQFGRDAGFNVSFSKRITLSTNGLGQRWVEFTP